MARARIYIRRSDDDQSTWSPEAQEREDRRWCADRDHEVVDIYPDDDLSGRREERPELQRLLRDAKADPGSIVVVHKFDRLARDTETLLRLVYKELLPRRVKVWSVAEAIDPYTALGKMMLTVSGGVSTYHVDNLATEVSKGLKEKFLQGGWVGPLPLGYESRFDLDAKGERVKGTGKAAFSADADTVRLIWESYATGNYSDLSLAEEMNERGFMTMHKGQRRPFQKDSIGSILTNPFYIGKVRYNGEERDGVHPALIDRAVWERVQEVRAQRAHAKPGGGRATFHSPDGLLLEIAYCGRCGARLHWNKGDKAEGRYWCSCRRKFGVTSCDAPLIPASPIEGMVFEVLRALTIPSTVRDAVIQVVQDRIKRTTPATADTAALTTQLERLRDMYQMGDIERADYIKQRERLQRQLNQATPPAPRMLDVTTATQLLSDMPSLLDAATPAQRRALLRQVVTTIWVEKNAVTAMKPAANFLILLDAMIGINGDLDWASDRVGYPTRIPPLWDAFRQPRAIGGAL